MTTIRQLPIRLEWMPGELSEHAALLCKIANATDRDVVEEFNGVDLIARPGQHATSVVNDWHQRRKALRAEAVR